MCKRVISLLVLVLLLVPGSGAWAVDRTWTNLGAGDSWGTPDNWWDIGGIPGVPTPVDVAIIDPLSLVRQ